MLMEEDAGGLLRQKVLPSDATRYQTSAPTAMTSAPRMKGMTPRVEAEDVLRCCMWSALCNARLRKDPCGSGKRGGRQ